MFFITGGMILSSSLLVTCCAEVWKSRSANKTRNWVILSSLNLLKFKYGDAHRTLLSCLILLRHCDLLANRSNKTPFLYSSLRISVIRALRSRCWHTSTVVCFDWKNRSKHSMRGPSGNALKCKFPVCIYSRWMLNFLVCRMSANGCRERAPCLLCCSWPHLTSSHISHFFISLKPFKPGT